MTSDNYLQYLSKESTIRSISIHSPKMADANPDNPAAKGLSNSLTLLKNKYQSYYNATKRKENKFDFDFVNIFIQMVWSFIQ